MQPTLKKNSLGRICFFVIDNPFLEGLEVQDLLQDRAQDAVAAVRVASVLIATVVAVIVAATKTFAEVVLIFG